MKVQVCSAPEVTVISEDQRILKFKISDETKDRYGDRVMVSGWDFKNYQKNPVLLFGHDYRQPAIGKAVKTYVEGSAVFGEFKFAGPDVYPFADTIYKLMKPPESYMKAVSVGFQPDEEKIIDPRDEEERSALGLGPRGVQFNGQELLEVSVVPVPANPNAVMDSVSRGTISSREAEMFARAYGEFSELINSSIKSEDQKRASCTDSSVLVKISELHAEIKRLSEIVEKFGQTFNGRSGDSTAQANAEQTLDADFWEKLLAHADSMASELKKVRNQV